MRVAAAMLYEAGGSLFSSFYRQRDDARFTPASSTLENADGPYLTHFQSQ